MTEIPYIFRKFGYDFSFRSEESRSQAKRVALAALPFLTLYKPLSYPISLGMGAVRLFTTGREFLENRSDVPAQFHALAAAAGVAGTLFGHPLGMLIATAHDLTADLGRLFTRSKDDTAQQKAGELLHVLNDLLYMALFSGGGTYSVAFSLSTQLLVGLNQAYTHFSKGGEKIEGTSHLLMALIRGNEAIRSWQQIYIDHQIERAKQEGKPYLPLANRAQLFFVNLGYRFNSLSRWTVRQVASFFASSDAKLGKMVEESGRVKTAAMTVLAAPFALAGLIASAPCYLLASYVGVGRFERIDPLVFPQQEEVTKVNVVFQNICGQNPWSIFSGGVLPPLETDTSGSCRVDGILGQVLAKKPHLFAGQEVEDLDTSWEMAQALVQRGYGVLRDIGAPDFYENPSGMFFAALDPRVLDSAHFCSFKREHTSGITSWCNRGTLSVTVPFAGQKSLQVVNIHLNSGSDDADQVSRLTQFHNYVMPLMKKGPTLVIGDSNLDTQILSQTERLFGGLTNVDNALAGRVTCTDEGKHTLSGKPRKWYEQTKTGRKEKHCEECKEKIDVAIYDPEQVTVSKIDPQTGHSDHDQISLEASLVGG